MRSFTRKVDADRFDTGIHHQIDHGSYVDPSAGQLTVEQYAAEWMARRHWRPATGDRIERELRLHILPGLARRPLASLRRAHLAEWTLALPLAASSPDTVFATLSSVLASALEDGRLPKNPAVGAKLPEPDQAPVTPLDVDQVRRPAGHDVATLLQIYDHVIRSDEDRVRQLVDESLSRAGSAEGWLRDEAPFEPPRRRS